MDEHGGGLDWSTPDDPHQALREGLLADDRNKAMGAWRLLNASGQDPRLSPSLAVKLAGLLESGGFLSDASRIFRLAAEQDPNGPEAPDAIFRAASLLQGLGQSKQAEALLRLLIERYPHHGLCARAQELIVSPEKNASLSAGLPAAMGLPPVAGSAPDGAAPATASARWAQLSQRTERALGGIGSPRWRTMSRVYQFLLTVCAITFGVTFLAKSPYKSVEAIDPALLQDPVQVPAAQQTPIRFERGDYGYELLPVADYDISGLVVSARHLTYDSGGLSEDVFPLDLCLLWGSNAQRRTYLNPGIDFEQHGRVCYVGWSGFVSLNQSEFSNNHLIPADAAIAKQIDSIENGDQVRLVGQLVDVKLSPVKGCRSFTVATSRRRDDTGYGACEIMYVRQVQMLKPAPLTLPLLLHSLSFWALLALAALAALRFALLPVRVGPA